MRFWGVMVQAKHQLCVLWRVDNLLLHKVKFGLIISLFIAYEFFIKLAQSGIALVPEDRRIIQGLTVEENIQLAQIEKPVGWSLERIYDLFPRLGERRKQEGTTPYRW